jgi:amino acid transporter
MKAKEQKHLGAFKVKIAIEALQEYETLRELSRKIGLHSNQIFRWKKEFLEQAPQIIKMSVAHRVGESLLDGSLSFILLLGSIGSDTASQFGASRLLYGTGRDEAIREYLFKSEEKSIKGFLLDFLPAGIGFLFCLFIWLNLPLKTIIIGGSWMMTVIIYLAVRTKVFRKSTVIIDFS